MPLESKSLYTITENEVSDDTQCNSRRTVVLHVTEAVRGKSGAHGSKGLRLIVSHNAEVVQNNPVLNCKRPVLSIFAHIGGSDGVDRRRLRRRLRRRRRRRTRRNACKIPCDCPPSASRDLGAGPVAALYRYDLSRGMMPLLGEEGFSRSRSRSRISSHGATYGAAGMLSARRAAPSAAP